MKRRHLLAAPCLVAAFAVGALSRPWTASLYHSLADPRPDPSMPAIGGYSHRHAALARSAAVAGETPCVWLGDSLTDGWRDCPDLWAAHFPGAVNLGVYGDRVENAHWRVAAGALDAPCRPKVVVVMLGTNNLLRGDRPEAVAAGVAALVAAVRRKQPDAAVLLLCPPPVRDHRAAVIRDFGEKLAGLADGGRVHYFEPGLGAEHLAADGVHLTPAGYAALGAAVGPVARRLCG